MYQNFWAPIISNSVFTLWTFRLTLQNLQKLLTFSRSLLSITNLLTFSAKLKLKFSLHHPYDLKINLEEDTQPPVGSIYSLLASEQEALKESIEENLNTDFI